jgi:CRISPR system Cascade subunit CasD
VALALVPEDEEPGLEQVSRALSAPARPLFLGRVSCPPAAPVFREEIVEADSPLQALETAPLLLRPGEPEPAAGLPAQAPWKEGDTPPGSQWAVRAVTDQRDWRNQVHVGRRLVAETLVEPPVRRLEVPL